MEEEACKRSFGIYDSLFSFDRTHGDLCGAHVYTREYGTGHLLKMMTSIVNQSPIRCAIKYP